MKRVVITIGKNSFSLRFGYGCFRHLAEAWNVKGLQGIMDRLGSIGETISDLEFDKIQMLIDLVWSAIYANGDSEEMGKFDKDDCGDAILSNPAILTVIINGIMESLPKSAPEDSGNVPAGKKKTAKKLPQN